MADLTARALTKPPNTNHTSPRSNLSIYPLNVPRHISADGLIPFLNQLGECADVESLELDFANLAKVTPAGLVALASLVAHRNRRSLATQFMGFDECCISSYLRRMDLPRQCGFAHLGEVEVVRDPKGRFIPLKEIDHPVDRVGSAFAEIIAPGGDDYGHPNAGLYGTAWYLITEIANNVRQHSQGRGFIAAQTTLRDGFIRIAIGDCGRGIPGSLKDAGYSWAQELTDEDIIARALEARISCKGSPTNEGVGLTLSSRLIDAMGGESAHRKWIGSAHSPEGRRAETEGPFGGNTISWHSHHDDLPSVSRRQLRSNVQQA